MVEEGEAGGESEKISERELLIWGEGVEGLGKGEGDIDLVGKVLFTL